MKMFEVHSKLLVYYKQLLLSPHLSSSWLSFLFFPPPFSSSSSSSSPPFVIFNCCSLSTSALGFLPRLPGGFLASEGASEEEEALVAAMAASRSRFCCRFGFSMVILSPDAASGFSSAFFLISFLKRGN